MTETTGAQSVTYGALVWQQFRRNRLALLGLIMVALLFVVGTFSPFIASNRPILVRVDPDRTSPMVVFHGLERVERTGWFSPIAESLTSTDITVVILFVWVALQALLRLLTVPPESPPRHAVRLPRRLRQALHWTLTALALALIVWTMTGKSRLPDVATDWESLRRDASSGDAFWMPPIPYRPYQQHLDQLLNKPDWWHGQSTDKSADAIPQPDHGSAGGHLLGTDQMGRDVASQLVHGARISMAIGFVSVGIAVVIGTFIGALGGYFGGKVDFWVMRVIEVMMCFPTIFLILTISVLVTERSIWTVMVIIGVTSWTGSARLVRGEFLKQRGMEYVTAARAIGGTPLRIMFRHILPNAMAPLLVAVTFGIAGAILTESTLSFLDLGVPPDIASWGRTLSYGLTYFRIAWWLVLFPGFAIFLTVTSYNLAGEGLRDAIDPRMRA